jgi:hypothetical protein
MIPIVQKKDVVNIIQTMLLKQGDKKRAIGQRKYLKNVVKCYGFKSKDLDDCLKNNILINKLVKTYLNDDTERYVNLAIELFKSNYFEEKEIGIRLLSKRIKLKNRLQAMNEKHLNLLGEAVFDNNNIKTWATCDSFCSRLTKVMLEERMKQNIETTPIIKVLKKWNRSKIQNCNNQENNNVQNTNWKQRASCVTFVCLVRRQWFVEICYDFVTHAIYHSNERFVQLGAGWLMRELSIINKTRTMKLLYKDYHLWSREGLRYAIEKLNTNDKNKLLHYTNNNKNCNRHLNKSINEENKNRITDEKNIPELIIRKRKRS